MKWGTRGTTAGGGRQQKQARGRWHFLAVQRGAFSPLHRKPLSIYCGHHWPGFLAVWDHSRAFPGGWRAPRAPPVAVCAPCRELPEAITGVSLAPSETCLWAGGIGQGQSLPAGGPQHPRGACVVVPTPRWVTASMVSQRGGTLSAVSREQAAAVQCRNVPPARGLLQSPAAPDLLQWSHGWRVQGWERRWHLQLSIRPLASVCIPNGSTCQLHEGSLGDSQPARLRFTPQRAAPLSCRAAGHPPSSLRVLGSQVHCARHLHDLGGFGQKWTRSAVKDNPTNHSWISLARKWAILIDAHSYFVYHSMTRASAPHKAQKLGVFFFTAKRLNTAGFLSRHTGYKKLLIFP